jgi:GNAT superfamily N-acetyltransferase
MRGRFEVNSDNIGNLLNNPKLEAYDREGSSMYVYDLAVSRQYRRNGIGSKLVGEIMLYCESKHIKDLFVHADAADRPGCCIPVLAAHLTTGKEDARACPSLYSC